MTGNWKTVRMILVVFVIAVLGTVSIAFSQSADDDVFAVVKVTNPEDVVAQIGMLVDKVEPGMGAMVNGMAMGQLQMLLKNPQWAGIDKTGDFTVVVMDPMKYPSPVALVLPMTNATEYVDILKQAMTGGEEVDGAMKFGQEGAQQMFFASSGNLGVLADNVAMVTSVKALIDAESPALKTASVAQGQLTASVAVTKIMASVRPMIEGFSQMMIMGMTQNMAGGEEGAQPPTAAITGALQAELNALLGLLDQTAKVELGISVDPGQGLRLMKAAFPLPDTAMANFFAAQTPKKSEMLGYLPGDAALVASGSMNFTPEFIEGYAAFARNLGSMAGSDDPAAAEKMVQFTKEAMAAFGGGLRVKCV